MNDDIPVDAARRRVLLVDCDQFFVQCARIADPEGAGREPLLLVGGSAEGRGVVTSASYETRKYGVRSGMPTARALELCPAAKVVGVPRGVCSDRSHAVLEVLDKFAPVVEPASIDEAYCDLSGTEDLYQHEELAATARRMQAAVLKEAGIVVSIGGGTTKLVAKLAVERAKPAGVHIVPVGGEQEFLNTLRLADLPGVGPVFADQLRSLGLVTVPHALCLDEASLVRRLGDHRGAWLYRRIRGLDSDTVSAERSARSMSRDETFAHDIDDDEALATELLALVIRLGHDLRSATLRARTISVRIRDADFRDRRAARTVPGGLESDRAIYQIARELLIKLRRARAYPARLLSVSASRFTEEGGATQLVLFGEAATADETDRDRALARATDRLKAKFGRDVIVPGNLLDHG